MNGSDEDAYKILAGKPKGKRRLWRPRHGRKDNIRMDPAETRWVGVDTIHLDQDGNQWRALEPSGSIKGSEFLD